jgi:WD40 repeat protein
LSRRAARAVIVSAAAALACAVAEIASAEEKPIVMLETGGHQSLIKSLAFIAKDKYLLSAGDDKVIRVWDWRARKTVRTIRGQVRAGPEGELYAMALTRDGQWLAVGGWEESDAIRLYDFASGELKALLKGHSNVVQSLAFSPDGRLLISGGQDKTAILWDVEQGTLLRRLEGHTDHIYGVDFTPDGARVVTASYDMTLRLWNVADGALLGEMRGHKDKIRSLAVSKRSGIIASGDRSGAILLWDGRSGKFLQVFARVAGVVEALNFSPDGKFLLSTCGQASPCHDRVWELASGRQVIRHRIDDHVVLAGAYSTDGRLAATAGGAHFEIHIWDPRTGTTKAVLKGTGRPVRAVGISQDGGRIAWGTVDPCPKERNCPRLPGKLERSLRLPPPKNGPERVATETYLRAQAVHGSWSLAHRQGGGYGEDAVLDILRDGKVEASIVRGSKDGYVHRSYSFTPDGEAVISGGGNGVLAAYRLDGSKIGDFIGHEGDVWAIAPSLDGRYLVSGAGDQTVRVWDLKTFELLVTLFHGDDGQWVMWTPEGFFFGSPRGAEIVGWQINQGADQVPNYVTADQIRKLFFRPDLVLEKLAGDPDGKVKQEAARLKVGDILTSGPAPQVTIVEPADGSEAHERSVTITARVTDGGGGIGALTWRINGQVKGSSFGTLNTRGEISESFELAARENLIEVWAANKPGFVQSLPAKVTIKVDDKVLKGVPDLYVLAVGVNQYKDVRRKLQFAVSDAKLVGETLAAAGKSFYQHPPRVIQLLDDEATADRLAKTFTDLGRQIKATDVFLLFMAGHGKTLRGDYYFIPREVEQFTDEAILRQAFGPEQWREWLKQINAEKFIWILDTCESGSAARAFRGDFNYEAAWQRLRDATGRTIFMAASEEALALEGYRDHGVFTFAFLEGLAKADQGQGDQITVLGLTDYVDRRVPEISRKLSACKISRPDEYCQRPVVEYWRSNYPLVPRYPKILDILGAVETSSIARAPTHAVKELAQLFQHALRGAPASRALQPGDLVRLIKVEGDWALVAQDGKIVGYVELRHLLKLNTAAN